MKSSRPKPVDPLLYDEAYFLGECEGYEEFVESAGRHVSLRLATALAEADLRPGMRVLDVGCGRGESLLWLSRQGVLACGMDYSVEALRIAKRGVATVDPCTSEPCLLLSGNAKTLPFGDQSFDRVLMLDIVEHLHPWELDAALVEAFRVLMPGGKLLVHTAPNLWYYRLGYPLFRLFARLRGVKLPRDPRDRFPSHRHVHVNEQSLVSLRRVLRHAGFRSRVWVGDTQGRWREHGRLGRLAGWVVTRVYPFKWVFCGDVYAVAYKKARNP